MNNINSQVCTHLDKWMHDTWVFSTRWIVELSNGETVWQDDGRPDVEEESAWVRLKNYCELNNLFIVSMRVEFRNNKYHHVWRDADGYFFSKLLRASFTSAKKMDVLNVDFYLLGSVHGDKVNIHKLHVPSLNFEGFINRDYEECKENIIIGKRQ